MTIFDGRRAVRTSWPAVRVLFRDP
jgi:hypothetical protein